MSSPAQQIKAHQPAEINNAKIFLNQYRALYPIEHSDTGTILMLVGFNNYLNAQLTGSSITPAQLLAAGFI